MDMIFFSTLLPNNVMKRFIYLLISLFSFFPNLILSSNLPIKNIKKAIGLATMVALKPWNKNKRNNVTYFEEEIKKSQEWIKANNTMEKIGEGDLIKAKSDEQMCLELRRDYGRCGDVEYLHMVRIEYQYKTCNDEERRKELGRSYKEMGGDMRRLKFYRAIHEYIACNDENRLKELGREYEQMGGDVRFLKECKIRHEYKTCNDKNRLQELERRYKELGGDLEDLKRRRIVHEHCIKEK